MNGSGKAQVGSGAHETAPAHTELVNESQRVRQAHRVDDLNERETNMTEYNVGDKLTLTREDGSVFHTEVWRLTDKGSAIVRFLAYGYPLAHFTTHGWHVTIQETAPEPLPTEPGPYSAPWPEHGDMGEWHTDGQQFHYLNTGGNWADIGWGNPEPGLKLTRFRPEAEVAAEIAKWLQTEQRVGSARRIREKWDVK